MPKLPEVEATKLSLTPLLGQTVIQIQKPSAAFNANKVLLKKYPKDLINHKQLFCSNTPHNHSSIHLPTKKHNSKKEYRYPIIA